MEIGKIGSNEPIMKVNDIKDKQADDSFERQLELALNNKDTQQLKKACQEFESIFLNMMYKQMRASVPKTDLVQKDPGKELFQTMLDEKLMEDASAGKGIGLGDMLYKQLSKNLEKT